MTASLFSNLPNDLIMNIIQINTHREQVERTKARFNKCLPFIEVKHMYGWRRGSPFAYEVDLEESDSYGVQEIDTPQYKPNSFIQVWGHTN
jgi:hypothetical protein